MTGVPPAAPEPSAAEIAAQWGLRPIGERPGLWAYLREIWQQRYFAVALAQSRVRARNSRNVLGPVWNVLQPLLLAGTYLLIFGVLVGTGRGIPNFAAYLAVGVFTFHFVQQSVNNGARSLTSQNALVRSMRIPRALLPIIATLEQLLLLIPAIAVLLPLIFFTGVPVSASWLLVVPVFALEAIFAVGLGMVFARIAARSHDFLQLLPTILRLWFYLSGVFWSIERVEGFPWLEFLFQINPAYVFIHLNREALLPEVPPADYASWWLALAWSVVALLLGAVLMWRGEGRYGNR